MKDESLGHKVTKLRKKKSLSQERLADKADLSQQHISRIERNLTYPSVATLSKIAKVLGVQLDDLVDAKIANADDKYVYEILRKLDFLDIAEKSKVSGYIDRILEDSEIGGTDRNVCFLSPVNLSREGCVNMKILKLNYYTNKIYEFAVMLAFSDGRHHRNIQH